MQGYTKWMFFTKKNHSVFVKKSNGQGLLENQKEKYTKREKKK